MLKIDKPIVEEFLGRNVDITLDKCSRLKNFRAYGKGKPLSDIIYVLTPIMANRLNDLMPPGLTQFEYETHKRGKNTVVTFKRC